MLVGLAPVLHAEATADESQIAAEIRNLGGRVRFDGDAVIEVSFEGKRISNMDLKILTPLRHIRKLNLEETPIGDEGLKHLSGLVSLEYLDLEETRVTDAGMQQLVGLKNLKTINLDDTRVTKRGEQILREAIPGIKIDR
jgi:hypothetical protein